MVIFQRPCTALLAVSDIEEVKTYLEEVAAKTLSVRDLEALISKNKVSRETMPLFEQKTDSIMAYEKTFTNMGYNATFKGTEEKGNITLKYKSSEELQQILTVFLIVR